MPNGETIAMTRAILLHMLGLKKECLQALSSLSNCRTPGIHKLRNALSDFVADDNKAERQAGLLQIALALEGVMNKGKPVDVTDEQEISRDPFKPIPKKQMDKVALAAACYLLRGYALFFCRPRAKRDFNAAKISLNDFHQSYQLSWRLYHCLTECHHQPQIHGLESYLGAVLNRDRFSKAPARSPYFVWSMLVLCEVMRGNIYRQIDYIEDADRFYRHAQDRFRQLHSLSLRRGRALLDKKRARWFLTPTMIMAAFERSKVLFDLGKFLESLLVQTRCLQYMIRLKYGEAGSEAERRRVKKVFQTFNIILRFLDAERTLPAFDREKVTYLFGAGKRETRPWGRNVEIPRILPTLLIECIPTTPASFPRLAVEIFARMGFTLYTLRSRMIARRGWKEDDFRKNDRMDTSHANWLHSYFRFDLLWNRQKPAPMRLEASHLGRYCETLFDVVGRVKTESTGSDEAFPDEIERKFALLSRRYLKGDDVLESEECSIEFAGKVLDEQDFYKAIFLSTTQNIGNILTIPRRNRRILMRRGYKQRRRSGDLSKDSVYKGLKPPNKRAMQREPGYSHKSLEQNKFVVLRRWQSSNPKIPRPGQRDLRGGGYYLLWQGKGIVIDPGYDFIQNFYDEGFSLEDIDAVLVTHSHPDHDDDLSTLITLVKEWNEFHRKTGQPERLQKTLDLFLNESAHRKFSSWLQASQVRIGRVVALPVVWWNKDSVDPTDGPHRGRNALIDLREFGRSGSPRAGDIGEKYSLVLEVVPAWHDDVIGKTSAVGLRFNLYARVNGRERKVGVIGCTGDTGAYGLDIGGIQHDKFQRIDTMYKDCDLLIAHLGDIKIRELASLLFSTTESENVNRREHPLVDLLQAWFSKVSEADFRSRVRDFLNLIVTLDLTPEEALCATVTDKNQQTQRVHEWLSNYLSGGTTIAFPTDADPKEKHVLTGAFESIVDDLRINSQDRIADITNRLSAAYQRSASLGTVDENRRAYLLLELLTACSIYRWQYPYHLGIFGVYRLFEAMDNHWTRKRKRDKVLVIGELPEELASYRHMVAHWLNMCKSRSRRGLSGAVRSFTGDIGLHISLKVEQEAIQPRIRCTYCNYNNEMVCSRKNYHSPRQILETPIKRHQGSMIYLCTGLHHPVSPDQPRHFLSSPELRVI